MTDIRRDWLTLEQEEVLRELGMDDPHADPAGEELLEVIEAGMEEADEAWERDFWEELLMELEMEA